MQAPHLHVRLRLGVRVLFRPLGELLGDRKLRELHVATGDARRRVAQRGVHRLYNVVLLAAGEDELEDGAAQGAREGAPVAAHDVQALALEHL